jgi:hypothetical protein
MAVHSGLPELRLHPKPKNRDRLCFEPKRAKTPNFAAEECQKEGLQQFIQLPVSGTREP